jgi:geranylgeranyl diphosphate synthase type I
MQALSKLQRIISLTVVGQAQDIFIEYRKKASEKDVMKMYEYKTARYTFEGPLHLGAILGGADKAVLDGFSKYSLPVGIAFQIQDDILGVFGVEKKVGKDVGADVREGKQTLLVVRAKEKANRSQLKIINSILGKQDITTKDLLQFQSVLRETGSLQYAKDLAAELIQKGQKALIEAPVDSECKSFLGDIAEYMIQRDV